MGGEGCGASLLGGDGAASEAHAIHDSVVAARAAAAGRPSTALRRRLVRSPGRAGLMSGPGRADPDSDWGGREKAMRGTRVSRGDAQWKSRDAMGT